MPLSRNQELSKRVAPAENWSKQAPSGFQKGGANRCHRNHGRLGEVSDEINMLISARKFQHNARLVFGDVTL
jgi:hypothetical protein